MKVLSVNIGTPKKLPGGRKPTGICKVPVAHAVRVRTLGLEGDAVCEAKHHGGPDQAVYLYGQSDYDWWSSELGARIEPGTFGENLTISDLISADYNIGDRFSIGEVILEVTAPRIPCGTLAKRMKDSKFPERFREAERPGLYCRVLREGALLAGNDVTLERATDPIVPILEIFRSFYRGDEDEQTLHWHLSAPLAIRAVQSKQAQLRKFAGSKPR